MTNINNILVPTCADLAKLLASFGDEPLFNGNGWLAVSGFRKTPVGVQINVSSCCAPNEDSYANRFPHR